MRVGLVVQVRAKVTGSDVDLLAVLGELEEGGVVVQDRVDADGAVTAFIRVLLPGTLRQRQLVWL